MAITYTWQVAEMERNTADDGVTICHWRCTGVDGEHTASSYGTTSHTPDPDTDEVVSVLVEPAQDEVKEQAIHREPRMETVEEEYTDYEERQIILEDGTPSVTLSIRHSVAHMKLFKAFEELAEKVIK